MKIKEDALTIIQKTLESVQPDSAVKKALNSIDLNANRIFLISIGKAAWSMANVAQKVLRDKITDGIVITKYDHVVNEIPNIKCFEAGHPISDKNTYEATNEALKMVENLTKDDLVLLLISGGGSSLFERPIIEEGILEDINKQLLESGASIEEINTIRKRLSKVKGGRFAISCQPARVEVIVLSDIIGDPLDMIASGPAYPDSSSSIDAINLVEKYSLNISNEVRELLLIETPKKVDNANHTITGSVRELVSNSAKFAKELGYKTIILTDELDCQAKEAGSFLGSIAKTHKDAGPLAIIAGGETVVEITGDGKGGRNQEIALSASEKISGLENVLIFSVGSDGTDGPTDAAGGIVDGHTKIRLEEKGHKIYDILKKNDSYNYLGMVDGLIKTGPTGTNVNDFSMVLIG